MVRKATLHPALEDLVRALARMAVAQEAEETTEAAPQIAELRTVLGFDDDFTAWKRKVEVLMKAFYKHVPHWGSMPLKDRLRFVTAAVRELGRTASYKSVVLRAGELALAETPPPPHRPRRRARRLDR
jgi:hypothetical protein